MNVSEFLRTVRDMRDAQKAYFKGRLSKDLIRSKDFERRVDKAIVEGVVFDLDTTTRIEVYKGETEQ